METKVKILLLAVVVFALVAGSAQATIVTIALTGEVTYLRDPDNLLGGQINIGDVITGSYTYDTSTPDTNPRSGVGDYWYSTAPYGINLSVGDIVFQTDPENVDFLVEIVNDYTGGDTYLLASYANLPLVSGIPVQHISWQLDDFSQTAVSSTRLENRPPDIEDWQSIFGLSIELGEKGGALIRGTVTGLSLIPEPMTVFPLTLGALILLKKRKAS